MDYRDEMLTLARLYCQRTGLSLARIATLVRNQGAFFKHIEDGKGCTVDTYNKVMRWFAERWPNDLAWPEGIGRPPLAQEGVRRRLRAIGASRALEKHR
ncbi:MAG TPA: hypothetical protein VHM01_07415 [Alphaproteobacteria bacterium]|nr:hypothetical protein [Alphaproteobacteria bacterium]